MNSSQRDLARHALGLPNRRRKSYRNHFAADPGSPDHCEWESMVKAGLASRVPFRPGELVFFRLTPEGAAMALADGESLDPEDFPVSEGEDE